MHKHLLLLLLFASSSLLAQGITTTTKDSTRHFKLGIQAMTLVIDKHGYTVIIPGIVVNADWYFWEKKPKMQLRFAGSWYKDSGFNNAGYVHAAIRRDFFKKEGRKWYVIAGLGPAFFMRDNWNYLYPGRVLDPFYGDRITKNGLYQYRFFPIGGELDFTAELNDKWDLNFSMVPGAPAAIIFKFGMRCQL